MRTKTFKVWVELEKEIEAKSQNEAEKIFEQELNIMDVVVNSCEIKEEQKQK